MPTTLICLALAVAAAAQRVDAVDNVLRKHVAADGRRGARAWELSTASSPQR
jgi:hypothetical protein